jgi:hypothetical protein
VSFWWTTYFPFFFVYIVWKRWYGMEGCVYNRNIYLLCGCYSQCLKYFSLLWRIFPNALSVLLARRDAFAIQNTPLDAHLAPQRRNPPLQCGF